MGYIVLTGIIPFLKCLRLTKICIECCLFACQDDVHSEIAFICQSVFKIQCTEDLSVVAKWLSFTSLDLLHCPSLIVKSLPVQSWESS